MPKTQKTKKSIRIKKIIPFLKVTTVHKDVTERLEKINPILAKEVRKILDENKAERHIRGGLATKAKYEKNHYLTIDNDKLIV